MCVFDRQGKTELMEDIRRVMPHIKDSDMEELAEQVLGKLQSMTDEKFAEIWKRQNKKMVVIRKYPFGYHLFC